MDRLKYIQTVVYISLIVNLITLLLLLGHIFGGPIAE
jgi:hypothetical protein